MQLNNKVPNSSQIDSRNALQAAQFGQKQTSEKKISDKEKKGRNISNDDELGAATEIIYE